MWLSTHGCSEAAGGPTEGGLFCVFLCGQFSWVQFSAMTPVFLVDEIMHEQTQNLLRLRLFPNVSIPLERIYVFKTNRADCSHVHKQQPQKPYVFGGWGVLVFLCKWIHTGCRSLRWVLFSFLLLTSIPNRLFHVGNADPLGFLCCIGFHLHEHFPYGCCPMEGHGYCFSLLVNTATSEFAAIYPLYSFSFKNDVFH